MTDTITYGHSSFATQRVHAWQPDKLDFSRALCGIRLSNTLIVTYARPTRQAVTWCPACYLLTEHTPGGEPQYVMRRSAVDACAHIVPAKDIRADHTYNALCGHGMANGVAQAVPAWPCENCLDAVAALTAQAVEPT